MESKFLLLYLFINMVFLASASAIDNNVHFSGALVSQPCTIPDADADINLEFGSIIEKSLYKYQRSKSKPFTIHLEDCNPSVLDSVNVIFEGTADTELPTMLAVDASSTAKGIAIGLETQDGNSLSINKASPTMQLQNGSNMLTFNAYVQATPGSISSKMLTAGDFKAVSTFVLQYQ